MAGSAAPVMGEQPAGAANSLHHNAVLEAVALYWNNDFESAKKLIEGKKDTHPRFALEWAFLHLVRDLMSATSQSKEDALVLFQQADRIAWAQRLGATNAPVEETAELPDEDEEGDPEVIAAAEADGTGSPTGDSTWKRSWRAMTSISSSVSAMGSAALKSAYWGSKLPDDPEALQWRLECEVVYADAMLVRSIVQLRQNSYVKGAVNIRKTWGYYLALIKVMEQRGDTIPKEVIQNIKFGVGVFYVFLTLVPSGLMKVLSAIGFISDSELGEQYLGEVFEGQGVRAPTAALILLTYYLFLPTGLAPAAETLRKAKAILDRTNAQYPGNSYFWGYSNFYHRKCGEAEEAAAAVEKAISHAGQTGAPPLLLRYMRADTLYMNMDWRKAANAYEGLWGEISEQNIAFEYSGQLVCTLSGALVMAGDVAKARELMERVPAATNPKSKQDAYFPKFAQRCGAEPKLIHLAGLQGLYVNRDLSSMKPESMEQLERYLDQAENAHDFSSSPEVEALALLFRGVLQYGTGRVLNARASWKKIIELGDAKKLGGESPTLPFSYYELGELEFREGNLDQAKKYFDTGVKLKGEKNDTLMNRYNRAIAHLKKALQEHEEKPAAVSSGGLEAAVPAAN